MLRRPFCRMATCFLLGILITAYGEIEFLPAVMLLIGAVFTVTAVQRVLCARWGKGKPFFAGLWNWQSLLRVGLCVVLFALGGCRYQEEQRIKEAYQPVLSEGMQLFVQGKLTGKQVKNDQFIYELSTCVIRSCRNEHEQLEVIPCSQILVYSDSDAYSIGEILVLDGTIKLWKRAANEGNFDAKSYYETRKIDFAMTDINVRGVYGRENRIREGLWRFRLRLKEIYQKNMSEETCGVMTTMVLGDKGLLLEESKRLYQVGGLSHIMAISGLHISVVGVTLYRLLRNGGLGFGMAGAFAGVLMYGYAIMVGMGISVQRAMCMFLLQLLGAAIGRSYDTLNSLGIAALFLLWKNPYLLWDAGFQFSFAAIIGVAWVGRSTVFSKEGWERLGGQCYVSMAIQLTTLPLVMWYYYEVPLYALFMNLLLLPMMGMILGFGIAGGVCGIFWARIAGVLLLPCEIALQLQQWLCRICEKLPGAMWITGRPKLVQVVIYYIILLIGTLWMYRRKERRRREREKQKEKVCGEASEIMPRACFSGKGRQATLQAVFGMVVVFGMVGMISLPIDRGFELDILDVGQGDGSFLRTEDGYTLFVDGGSSDVSKVGTYRILPFLKYKGAGKVDAWLVSHTDEDHISGLREILESGYRIEYLFFSSQVVKDEALSELLLLAEEAGTEVVYLSAGDVIQLGEATVRAVFPVQEMVGEDKNASSLVVWYEEGTFTGIFTGDIGSEQEEQMLSVLQDLLGSSKKSGQRREKELSQEVLGVDFYKAAHHGSKYSNSPEILEVLKPRLAVISCGEHNRYGHPHEETIERLKEVKSEIKNTAESGEIMIKMKEGLEIRGYKEEE